MTIMTQIVDKKKIFCTEKYNALNAKTHQPKLYFK